MDKQYCVYIMTNPTNRVLYTGVTSHSRRRVWEHRNKLLPAFTTRYNVVKLVYFECCRDVLSAIGREKQIKGGSRARKVALIEELNPKWKDLYEEL